MYTSVIQQFSPNFGEFFDPQMGFFPKKPCKSTMLGMDYQI